MGRGPDTDIAAVLHSALACVLQRVHGWAGGCSWEGGGYVLLCWELRYVVMDGGYVEEFGVFAVACLLITFRRPMGNIQKNAVG
jgi:hypothetical protein